MPIYPAGPPAHLLIVDDNLDQLRLLIETLRSARYRLSIARDATAATVTLSGDVSWPFSLEPYTELAGLARDGRLSDIENWLDGLERARPDHVTFYDEIRPLLNTLDFERIESLALSGKS